MFIKKSFVDEIAASMENHLVDGAINKQAEAEARLFKAADYLNAAAEIFDESGLVVHAEIVTSVLESLAGKKSKKKKVKPKAKKKPAPSKKMTSNKMVENLKEKGWMFDESDVSDHNHVADENCAACGDLNYASSEDTPKWWRLFNDRTGGSVDFRADRATAERAQDRRNKTIFPGWELEGPFESLEDIDAPSTLRDIEGPRTLRDFSDDLPDTIRDFSNAKDSKENELYDMLEDFKQRSDEDFEDEDDLRNPDAFSLEDVDPNYSGGYYEEVEQDEKVPFKLRYPNPRISFKQ